MVWESDWVLAYSLESVPRWEPALASLEESRTLAAYREEAASVQVQAAASAPVQAAEVLPEQLGRRAFRHHLYRYRLAESLHLSGEAVPGI